jgi:UDP-glucose 4-epimerase
VLVEPAPDIYAMSKRLGEEICRIHSAPATVVRLTSVFGPGQVASEGATGAIASFAAAALAAEPITIPGDPNRTRDFVLADDLAPMFERIVADGIWNETFTAARGETATLLETAELVRDAAGTEIEIHTPGGDLAPGENESYEADPPPARLGLELRPLKEGIELYVDWLSRYPAPKSSA